MSFQIDHFVWAVPDLDEGCTEIERLFGTAPVRGGSHPGLGTCNALLSLGQDLYLEVMAPEAPQPGSVGERLAGLESPGLATWVIRSGDLAALSAAATDPAVKAAPLGPVPTKRLTPQGDELSWELLFLTQHRYGGLVPFAIDWQATQHPSTTSPIGGALEQFEIRSTNADALNALFTGLGIARKVQASVESALVAQFDTSNGRVELQSTSQTLGVLDM